MYETTGGCSRFGRSANASHPKTCTDSLFSAMTDGCRLIIYLAIGMFISIYNVAVSVCFGFRKTR